MEIGRFIINLKNLQNLKRSLLCSKRVIQFPLNILHTVSTINIPSFLMINHLETVKQRNLYVLYQVVLHYSFYFISCSKKCQQTSSLWFTLREKACFPIPSWRVNMPYLLPWSDSTVSENPRLETSIELIILFLRNERHVLIL